MQGLADPADTAAATMNEDPPRKRAATYLWAAAGPDTDARLLQQRTLLAAFGASQGLELVAEFADHGAEPTTGLANRPGLVALITAICRGELAVTLAEDADALSQDPLQRELMLHELQNAGIEFLTANAKELTPAEEASSCHLREVLNACTDFGAHDAVAALRVARPRMSALARVRSEIQRMRERKINFTSIARRLNDLGLRTADGAPWTRMSAFEFSRGM